MFKDYTDMPRGFVSGTIIKENISYEIVSLHQQSWTMENDTTIEVRKKQSQQVKNHIMRQPVSDVAIIMGDFNFVSSEEIRDTWEDFSHKTNVFNASKDRKTWEPYPYFGYDNTYVDTFANLDNIIVQSRHELEVNSEMLLPKSIQPENQEVLVSDHKPLFATIEVKSRSLEENEQDKQLHKYESDYEFYSASDLEL
jgi:endonuclease/exonuclease/phosphatase family metal-dependent hydrolase